MTFIALLKPNKEKIIVSVIFMILIYIFGCWLTYYSTQCACECPEGPEISYINNEKMSGDQHCYDSLLIPFDNHYGHTNCCITFSDVILDYFIVLIISLLFYTVYSVIEFIVKKQKI